MVSGGSDVIAVVVAAAAAALHVLFLCSHDSGGAMTSCFYKEMPFRFSHSRSRFFKNIVSETQNSATVWTTVDNAEIFALWKPTACGKHCGVETFGVWTGPEMVMTIRTCAFWQLTEDDWDLVSSAGWG